MFNKKKKNPSISRQVKQEFKALRKLNTEYISKTICKDLDLIEENFDLVSLHESILEKKEN